MKTFYINSNNLDALRVFWYYGTAKAEEIEKRIDEETAENEKTFTKYFDLLQHEKISCFYSIRTTGNYKTVEAYHRSPKNAGQIQKSYYHIDNGKFIPIMDSQYKTAADAIKDGTRAGVYVITA